jgi:hypothetical protein
MERRLEIAGGQYRASGRGDDEALGLLGDAALAIERQRVDLASIARSFSLSHTRVLRTACIRSIW